MQEVNVIRTGKEQAAPMSAVVESCSFAYGLIFFSVISKVVRDRMVFTGAVILGSISRDYVDKRLCAHSIQGVWVMRYVTVNMSVVMDNGKSGSDIWMFNYLDLNGKNLFQLG